MSKLYRHRPGGCCLQVPIAKECAGERVKSEDIVNCMTIVDHTRCDYSNKEYGHTVKLEIFACV